MNDSKFVQISCRWYFVRLHVYNEWVAEQQRIQRRAGKHFPMHSIANVISNKSFFSGTKWNCYFHAWRQFEKVLSGKPKCPDRKCQKRWIALLWGCTKTTETRRKSCSSINSCSFNNSKYTNHICIKI